MDDPQLIQLLMQNDSDAFRIMVEKYQAMVVKTSFFITRSQQDAEDIAQDVFIEVYQSIHRFRNESKLSTWLYRITVNKSLNFVRKEKWKKAVLSLDGLIGREKESPRELPDIHPENMPESIEYRERRDILQKAIDSLPKNQRIAFILNKYNEQSYQEVASVMDLSLASVESLIHRAKLNLQKKLINYYKKTL